MTVFQTDTSPTSVRCFLDGGAGRSLASEFKSLDVSDHSAVFCDPEDVCSTSCSSSSSSQTSVSRRRVRFLPVVRAKNTISRYDMTDEEIRNSFLQEEEYDEIWEHNQRLLRRAMYFHQYAEPLPTPLPKQIIGFEDDIEAKKEGGFLCTRGLESVDKANRRKSIDTVLLEQEYQIMEGFYDDDFIAEIYAEASSACRFRAVCQAMEDRLDA
jgi:hypothetical protein